MLPGTVPYRPPFRLTSVSFLVYFDFLVLTFFSITGTVTPDSTNLALNTYGPGETVAFTLNVAPETDLSIAFCAPGWLVFDPPQLSYAAGQTVATVQISAQPLFDTPPPSPIVVGLDVLGTDALSYAEPGDLSVDVSTNGTRAST